jgi:hypothetical protein
MHVTRPAAAALAAALSLSALTGLAACGGQEDAVAHTRTVERDLNPLEHEAQRQLAEIREQQQRNINANEHRGLADVGTPRSASEDACRALLMRRLTTHADGYERYLLRQPPCSDTR